ncbi:hypothetical protein [Streptoalloteichus hindustanus]|uniref:Small secreted domain n=1 Tax=Streptoalloteichus hindustanus TaxID=2017 RepID=A0A1M5IV11_STRHI|nr:hypothetical protein [Streptoalloteichus hindustanus]SHG31879.1 hypothetical protein SAMN05444320_1087 [Streptoalloteichus hindustanus]
MLRKTVGVVAATAGALAMIASPAVAGGDSEDNDWNGAINILNANQIQIPICIAQNNIAILGVAVPILSPQFMGSCATAVATQEG